MKFSFVTPAYNSEGYIEMMLDSIPKEYAYEIIVCDDGSTDRTLEILENYQKTCPQLQILKHEVNKGTSESYNDCLAAVTGDYVAIIDSDDIYLPTIIDVLQQIDGTYDIYYYNMLTKEGSYYIHGPVDWPGNFKIFRSSLIGDAKYTKKPTGADLDFYNSLLAKNPTRKHLDIFAYWYNYPREGSESDLYFKSLKGFTG